jgi:hypothetical protein
MGLLYKSDFVLSKTGTKKIAGRPFDAEIEREAKKYAEKHLELYGLIFDVPDKSSRQDAVLFSTLIKSAVMPLGFGVTLHSNRTLVLVPSSVDHELLTHHICTQFHIKNIHTFSMTKDDNLKDFVKRF